MYKIVQYILLYIKNYLIKNHTKLSFANKLQFLNRKVSSSILSVKNFSVVATNLKKFKKVIKVNVLLHF